MQQRERNANKEGGREGNNLLSLFSPELRVIDLRPLGKLEIDTPAKVEPPGLKE